MTGLWIPGSAETKAEATPAPKLGPVRWCKRCSRRHPSRQACNLAAVAVTNESGRLVQRLVHPEARS